ncbi:hypothetical protein [Erythrobacter colymbi]|uniref:hypothetical protein n=1 Tax=Erythrobacter colymbi TaxID=1161202 RepID=UPI000A37EE56|nr:hypothetical protein [Erythrobacter colymbi]
MLTLSELYDLMVQMGVIGGAITSIIFAIEAVKFVWRFTNSLWHERGRNFVIREILKSRRMRMLCLRDQTFFIAVLGSRALQFILYALASFVFTIAIINSEKFILSKEVLRGFLYFYLFMAQIAMIRLWFLLAYIRVMRRKVMLGLKPRLTRHETLPHPLA